MIPYRVQIERRTFPIITIILILVNFAVFSVELILFNVGVLQRFIDQYSVIPYEIMHNTDLDPTIGMPVYVTLLTSMFLHASFPHIIGNMLYLWIFGRIVEDRFGHLRFLAVYLLFGLLASLTFAAASPNSITGAVGASGAIAGVLGAHLIMFPAARVNTIFMLLLIPLRLRLPTLIVIGEWLVLQFAGGYVSLVSTRHDDIAYFAHIGGAVAGMVAGLIYRVMREEEFQNEWNTAW